MDESQILKGILESCVLHIISQEETYGYENVIEGTLYPILTRLEKKKYIQCRKAKSLLGPTKKYFSITPLGQENLDNYLVIYKKTIDKTNQLLFNKEDIK